MAKPCAAARALPLDELWQGLNRNCLSDRTLRALQQNAEFRDLQFRAHQIFYIVTWARAEFGIELSIGALMRAFNCSRCAVQSALANGWAEPKSRGRHPAVDEESDANILSWVKQKAEKGAAVTRTDIRHYCRDVCKVEVSRGWVDSFLFRHNDELTEKKSSPQEEARLQVPRVFLDETIRSMHEAVQGCASDLVFNLDEVGISDWEDRKPKKVVVPITVGARKVHHRISRNVKHISIVTCISASGACLTPYVVTSQDSTAVRRDLQATGMQIGVHLRMEHRDKPYVNAQLFQNYVETVFLPHLQSACLRLGLPEEEAVLLMDNCSPHLTGRVLELLSAAHVRVVTFAPHTTQIFQVLDLSLFGVLKQREKYHLPFDEDSGTVHFISKVYHDFRSTMTDANIWGAFRGIGITYEMVNGVQRVSFSEMKLRESVGFRELWDIDFPLEGLSVRRQRSKFGWINRPQ